MNTLKIAALAALAAVAGCIQVKTESEIKPIHITMDVNLKVDKELDKAFADESKDKPQGDFKAVKALLEAGCPVNFSRWVPGDEISPLRAALLNGRDTVARLLHARGGMNLLNGTVYPVPPWIGKPGPLDLQAIRRACGTPTATPVLIDPIIPLPAKLSRLRAHWLEDAKELNGNCLSLVQTAMDAVVFRFARRLYVLRRESVAMDEHAFAAALDEICRDLVSINVTPILL